MGPATRRSRVRTDGCQDKLRPGSLGNSQTPTDGADHSREMLLELNEWGVWRETKKAFVPNMISYWGWGTWVQRGRSEIDVWKERTPSIFSKMLDSTDQDTEIRYKCDFFPCSEGLLCCASYWGWEEWCQMIIQPKIPRSAQWGAWSRLHDSSHMGNSRGTVVVMWNSRAFYYKTPVFLPSVSQWGIWYHCHQLQLV